MEDATALPSPHGPTQTNQMGTSNKDSDSKLYELNEQLLLLASLVTTVTYLSGLNLLGGNWQQMEDGHVAGNPILRYTDISRYRILYSFNATAFASSVMVCLILVMLRRNRKVWTMVLPVVMVVDLLSVIGSFAAGTCRDAFTTIFASGLAFAVLAYIAYAFIPCYVRSWNRGRDNTPIPINTPT